MAFTAPVDILVTITVPSDSKDPSSPPTVRTERRITPTWTISQLKAKLEPITGIPSTSQSITHYNELTQQRITLSPETTTLDHPTFGISRNSELQVHDLRPPGARQNFTDVSGVEKYEMPPDQYEKLDDSVLAWKRKKGLGRFDPGAKSAGEMVEERRKGDGDAVKRIGIEVGKRCRVGGEDERRGTVKFVGEIDGLGGEKEKGFVWVGVELDEPVGRNDGSVKVDGQTRKVFECKGDKFGVLARPEKIEVGEFPELGLDDLDEDMEEI